MEALSVLQQDCKRGKRCAPTQSEGAWCQGNYITAAVRRRWYADARCRSIIV